jgi:hypothetical protein
MGVYYETIPPSLTPWILAQKMLWVGTAPLSPSGHINISPKGGQTFGVLSPTQFWFLDLTGSGVETTAHLHEPGNGRICIMFMAFEGPPRILRLWGKGRAVERGTREYEEFVEREREKGGDGENPARLKNLHPGARSIILLDVDQVATSCGFSVPFYEFKGFRRTLDEFFEKKDREIRGRNGNVDEDMVKYVFSFPLSDSEGYGCIGYALACALG